MQDILAQPAHDFLSTGRHDAPRTDPTIITELIADPATPQNIVELLERAQFLQDNVDDKTLNDLSTTATELILYGEIISKKMAEKNFVRSKEESERLDALKIEIVRISSFILDCIGIAHEEMKKKRAEHYKLFKFVSEHPIESLKIVTPILAHVTQKIVRLAVVLAPYDDAGPDLFVQHLTDGTISDLQKIPLEELTALVDATSKSVVDFIMSTSRREQVRGTVNFGFDLIAQHLILKSCTMLKSTLRTNFIQANVLQSVATTAEELTTLEATAELASKQKQLVQAIEHAVEGDLIPATENVGRTQRVNEILDAATEFSQSEKALEIKAILDRKNALNLIETSKELTEFSHIYRKETVIEAIRILEITAKSLEDKEIKKEFLLMIKKIAKLNSHPEWVALKPDAKNQVTKESIEKALKTIAPYEAKIAKNTIESLCKTQAKDSVWHKIQPTEGLHPETLIPRSFVIDVEGTKLWVTS